MWILGVVVLLAMGWLAFAVLGAIVWAAIHILPWVAVSFVPGFLLFLYLRSERVRLTARAQTIIVLGAGAAAWLATALLTSSLNMASYHALALGPAVFLFCSLLQIIGWESLRKVGTWIAAAAAREEATAAQRAAESWERRLHELQAEERAMDRRHGEAIRTSQSAAEEIDRLCSAAPRAMGLVAGELRTSAQDMTIDELQAAIAAVSEGQPRPGCRLRAAILRRELASRFAAAPLQRRAACATESSQIAKQLAETRAELARQLARALHRAEYARATRRGPTVL